MTVSERIRFLAREGLRVAEITRRLGIRYQHSYSVLNAWAAKSLDRRREPEGGDRAKGRGTIEAGVVGGQAASGRV